MAISLSTNAIGQSGNITALASISTTISCKVQMRVDTFRLLGNSDSAGIWQVCDATGGTHAKILLYWGTDGSGNVYWTLNSPGQGGIGGTGNAIATSTLPANGTDMIIYADFDSTGPTQHLSVYDSSGSGTPYYSVSGSSNLGTLSTTGGVNGAVLLNDTNPSNRSVASEICGIAFYNVKLTGANQYSAPASGDSGIVAMWKLNDATSGTTPTSGSATVGSQAMVWSGTYVWANDNATGAWFGTVVTTVTVTGIGSTTTIGGIAISGTTHTLLPSGIASTTSIGTVSTTGTSNPLVTGGRALFTLGSGNGAFDVSSAAIQALTAIGIKLKFDAGALAGMAINSTMAFWMIDDNAAGTGTNCKCRAWASTDASGNISITFQIPGQGGLTSATFLASALPAAGNDVICHIGYAVGNQQIQLFDSLGNTIVSTTGSQNLGALPVITGNGFLHVNIANHPTVNPTGPTSQAMNIDGLAVYNAPLAGANQSSTPSATDTGIVSFYRFDEQSGALTADDLHGPNLNLFNFSWLSGGTWLASNTTKITVVGLGSTTTIGTIVAGSNAVLITPVGIPTTTTITLVQEEDGTVYALGTGTTSTLGTISLSTFTGPLITGIPSTTSLGLVLVQITNVVAPPPAGGPPIGGITGVAALPPSTLAYIAQMAALFSTANVDATGSVALPDPTVICQRVNADQAGIFAKIAERNRTRFLRIAPVVTTNASSGRVIDLTQLAAPVQRPLQLNLADGRTVSFVDIEDQGAELAPRAYIFATNIVEVGNDFSVAPGPVQGTFYYVQGPLPLKLNGDLTQSVTVPGDWSDLLILPLAAWIAATDVGRPPDEPQRIMEMYESRMEAFLNHLDHYAGVPAMRFSIPRPLATAR